MKYEKFNLKKTFSTLKYDVEVTAYIVDNSKEISEHRKHPTIVICPGGGYKFTSDREAEPIALKFISHGYNAVVLRYSVAPVMYPNQLLEISAAVAFVRIKADEWNTDPNKIVVLGASSGGNLACSLGVMWHEEFIKDTLKIRYGENKPNAMILLYPVITSGKGKYAHKGSFDVLLGENASQSELDNLSLEKRVTKNTPQAFLWHTYDDETVPCENSLLFASALKEHDIPFELHIYRSGKHGLSLCTKETSPDVKVGQPNPLINPHVGTWFNLCLQWLDEIF